MPAAGLYYVLLIYELIFGANRLMALWLLLFPFAAVFIYEIIKNKMLIKYLPSILFFVIMGCVFANLTCGVPDTAKSDNLSAASDSEVQSEGSSEEKSPESDGGLSGTDALESVNSGVYGANAPSQGIQKQETDQISVSDKDKNRTVYVGKSGSKYHSATCHTLKGKGTAISLEEAVSQGKEACKICCKE